MFWIERFTDRGHKFPHVYEVKITTINSIKDMTQDYYLKQQKRCYKLLHKEKFLKIRKFLRTCF